MLTHVSSAAILGVDAYEVQVEADISGGLPHFLVVGLGDTAVQESRERVRAAIKNAGFPFPASRITINLAPADVRKEGPAFDLPIALALLAAQGILPQRARACDNNPYRTVAMTPCPPHAACRTQTALCGQSLLGNGPGRQVA